MGGTATTAGYRLSPHQECIWEAQHGKVEGHFRTQCAIHIEGRLDQALLRRALELVIERHEILRTFYLKPPGFKKPFQVPHESAAVDWEVVDRRAVAPELCGRELDDLFEQQRSRALDIERGPLVRALLTASSPDKRILILSMPSLCADARSLQNLTRDLAASYAALTENRTVPEAPMRYVQFSEWRNELVESQDENSAQAREYWDQTGRNAPSLVFLFEKSVPSTAFEPRAFSTKLDRDLCAPIRTAAERGGASEELFLLACWTSLLWRLIDEPLFSVGARFDGRSYEELANAIGVFATNLPVECRVASDFRFRDVLQQLQRTTAQAAEWQEYYTPGAHPAVNDLQFEFTQNIKAPGGTSFSLLKQYVCSERFKLRLFCVKNGDEVALTWCYDSARLELSAIERLATEFQMLVRSAVSDPEQKVARLKILDTDQARTIVLDWNQTASEYPHNTCIHELFEQQAASTPQRIAVRCGEDQLTYGSLNARANQVAHRLRRTGVRPDSVVGLCLERSTNLLVGVLGILKAGGAYVPLSPENPKPRLLQQLQGAVAVVTEQRLASHLPGFEGLKLCLDDPQNQLSAEQESNPGIDVSSRNLVYVLYTSGSTGTPKGVAVEHRNLVNYSQFICRLLRLDQNQALIFATVSTMAADLGNTCIYPSLISGGCLDLIPYDVATDAGKFAQHARQHPIDVLKIVPSHLIALLHSGEGGDILPRKYLLTGGETLTAELVTAIRAQSACQLINHYGPTETTVGSLTFPVSESSTWQSASVPIGRPIANTQVYVLDSHLQPVPVGVVGELYIAGHGVTRGYFNRPELTAERFIPDPFGTEAGSRMYKTGDRARYLSDGSVEFLGRHDDQVKVRGFRVELGEIEAALKEHSGIRQAVVIAQEAASSEKRLVAYVVPSREAHLTDDVLRAHLAERLPDYMMPAAFAFLEKLPLNTNGKVDKKALPDARETREGMFVAPRTPAEEKIAGIWTEALRQEKISVHDDVFRLGAHSLMATQVISRVRRMFDVELPLRVVFDAPTVAGLAERVERARISEPAVAAPRLTAVAREKYKLAE